MSYDPSGMYGQPAPKKSKKKGYIIGALILVIGICLLLCAGIVSAISPNDTNGSAPTGVHTANPPVTSAESAGPAEHVAAPVKTSAPKPKPVATKTTIDGDDIVHVGEDKPAGTYRAETAVEPGSMCYWEKSSDAEGSNIIDNDIPQGGRPQVTLKKGQWFSTQGCPTWVKK